MRSKFKVDSVTNHEGGHQSITLFASLDKTDNDEFWKYTPSGKLDITICNPNAKNYFTPGDLYYLDFSPVRPVEKNGE